MSHSEIITNVFRSGFDMTEIAWDSWVEPGREGVEHHILWAPAPNRDEDSAALLLRFIPGAHGDYHRHLGFELMLVLDGVLESDSGESYSAGTLVIEPPDSMHQMSSRQGCTVLAIRSKPAQALSKTTTEQDRLKVPG